MSNSVSNFAEFCIILIFLVGFCVVVNILLNLSAYAFRNLGKSKKQARYVLVYFNNGFNCTFFQTRESAGEAMYGQYLSIKSETVSDGTVFDEDFSKIIHNQFAILSDRKDNMHVWEIFKIPEEVM